MNAAHLGEAADQRDMIEVVAMDGFTGFKIAAMGELPKVTTVLGPFHVTRLAGRASMSAAAVSGKPSTATAAAKATRSMPHAVCRCADLLNDKQKHRLGALFADDAHVGVEATWGIYQRMITAYRHKDRRQHRQLMVSVSAGVPNHLRVINDRHVT